MGYLNLLEKIECTGCKNKKPATLEYFHRHGQYNGKIKLAHNCKECRKGENGRYYNTEEKKIKYRLQKRRYDISSGRIRKLLKSYKERDAKAGRDFDITKEWVKENIIGRPCFYCGVIEDIQAGIDRVDNNIGHTTYNCIPSCMVCNVVRSNIFTVDEMKEIGAVIRKLKFKRNILKSFGRSKSELYSIFDINKEINKNNDAKGIL